MKITHKRISLILGISSLLAVGSVFLFQNDGKEINDWRISVHAGEGSTIRPPTCPKCVIGANLCITGTNGTGLSPGDACPALTPYPPPPPGTPPPVSRNGFEYKICQIVPSVTPEPDKTYDELTITTRKIPCELQALFICKTRTNIRYDEGFPDNPDYDANTDPYDLANGDGNEEILWNATEWANDNYGAKAYCGERTLCDETLEKENSDDCKGTPPPIE